MRTTLTLDDDVADFLKEQNGIRGVSFKQVVNQLIRQGMTESGVPRKTGEFQVVPHDSEFLPGIDYMRLNQISDELEADDFAAELNP